MQQCREEVGGEGGGGEREGRSEKGLDEGEVRMRAEERGGWRRDDDTLRAGVSGYPCNEVLNERACSSTRETYLLQGPHIRHRPRAFPPSSPRPLFQPRPPPVQPLVSIILIPRLNEQNELFEVVAQFAGLVDRAGERERRDGSRGLLSRQEGDFSRGEEDGS